MASLKQSMTGRTRKGLRWSVNRDPAGEPCIAFGSDHISTGGMPVEEVKGVQRVFEQMSPPPKDTLEAIDAALTAAEEMEDGA